MKLFICTDHKGHWGGTASIVLAKDEEEARKLLKAEFLTHGLEDDDFTLERVPQTKALAIVLQNGDY